MRVSWRIIAATSILALATPYVAGLAAMGYGFNEQARQGALYHWLYAVPLLLKSIISANETIWLIGLIVIYAVQYLLLFLTVSYGIILLQRAVRRFRPMWPQDASNLFVWLLAGTALVVALNLVAQVALWFAPLPATVALLICHPSQRQDSLGSTNAQHGT
jgi:hypothetical protein